MDELQDCCCSEVWLPRAWFVGFVLLGDLLEWQMQRRRLQQGYDSLMWSLPVRADSVTDSWVSCCLPSWHDRSQTPHCCTLTTCREPWRQVVFGGGRCQGQHNLPLTLCVSRVVGWQLTCRCYFCGFEMSGHCWEATRATATSSCNCNRCHVVSCRLRDAGIDSMEDAAFVTIGQFQLSVASGTS